MPRRLLSQETLFGIFVAGAGVFLLITGREIVSPAVWGPALMPQIVAWGLVVLGAATAADGIRGLDPVGDAGAKEWRGFAWTLGAVAVFGALIEAAGFPLAAGVMFAMVARGFGSARPGRDLVIGLALAGAAYLVFAAGLGMQISWGGMVESALKGR